MTIARKPRTNKRQRGVVRALFVTSRRLHWRDSRQDPYASSSHPRFSCSSCLSFSFLSLSPVLHSMDRSSGSYGGTHAKRRHVTGIRIVDDRWRFLPVSRTGSTSNCFGGARDTVHWPTQIWSLSSLGRPSGRGQARLPSVSSLWLCFYVMRQGVELETLGIVQPWWVR